MAAPKNKYIGRTGEIQLYSYLGDNSGMLGVRCHVIGHKMSYGTHCLEIVPCDGAQDKSVWVNIDRFRFDWISFDAKNLHAINTCHKLIDDYEEAAKKGGALKWDNITPAYHLAKKTLNPAGRPYAKDHTPA